jgi:hypothetical protein
MFSCHLSRVQPVVGNRQRNGSSTYCITRFRTHVRWVPVTTTGSSSGCGWGNGLYLWSVAANILNKQPRTNDKEYSSSLGVGLTTPHRKNKLFTNNLHTPRTWTDSLDKGLKLCNMDMRFGTWNVRSLYRAGSLMTVSRELARYKI